MAYTQNILYHVNLPRFLIQFKQNVNRILLPPLISLKEYINNENNSVTIHPVISVIFVIILFVVIKNIYNGLFEKTSSSSSQLNNNSTAAQSQQLARQLNDLKKQLKCFYASFSELTKYINNIQKPQITKEQTQNNLKLERFNGEATNLWKQLQPLYNSSIESNKKLALYILQTQVQMLKQLKKLKKANRLSASSGRQSTTRSKTSDKKYLSSQASTTERKNNLIPVKQNNLMTQPSIEVKVNKQNNQNIGSSSSLSTSLPQNSHSNTSSILEKEKQKQKQKQAPKIMEVPKTNLVPLVNAIRNTKPLLPKVKARVMNIVEEDNNNDSGDLIKRAEITLTSPQKNVIEQQKKNDESIQTVKIVSSEQLKAIKREQPKISNIKSPETKSLKKVQFQDQKTPLITVQSNEQKRIEPQISNSNIIQSQQVRTVEQDVGSQATETLSQPIPPPKLVNMKKLNPSTKMNTGRRAPPPPPRK